MECRECEHEEESLFHPRCANCWDESTWVYRNFKRKGADDRPGGEDGGIRIGCQILRGGQG